MLRSTLCENIAPPPCGMPVNSPTTASRPPTRVAASARSIVAAPPTSTVRSTPSPSVRAPHSRVQLGIGIVVDGLVGPERRQAAQRSALDDVTITRAPNSLANCSAKVDTPPAPCSSTVIPGSKGAAPHSACQAVTAAQGRVAPSAKLRCAGRSTASDWSTTTSSHITPWLAPPRPAAPGEGRNAPPSQSRLKVSAMRSPTVTRHTSGAASITSPAPSDPGIRFGSVIARSAPVTTRRSR